MEDSDQLGNKRLNDLFPINYFNRVKIKKVAPLCFEHRYYEKFDRFQVIETGSIFRIDSVRAQSKNGYLYHWLSGPKELKPGYTTFFLQNDARESCENFEKSFDRLRMLLGSKDYYHVADIIYDLSNKVDEIPDKLINFILETCDETNNRIYKSF